MCKKPLSQKLYERAKEQEIRELIDKMGSRNEIVFLNDENNFAPSVLCTHSKTENYLDRIVMKIAHEDGVLKFLVRDEFGNETEIGVGDIEYGHIDFITSAIPLELSFNTDLWYKLKEEDPNRFIIFRCGNVYEILCEDAMLAHKIIGTDLNYHAKAKEKDGKRLRFSYFSYTELDVYLPKLTRYLNYKSGTKPYITDGKID